MPPTQTTLQLDACRRAGMMGASMRPAFPLPVSVPARACPDTADTVATSPASVSGSVCDARTRLGI